MGILAIILIVFFGGATLLTALERWLGPGRGMVRWLVTGPLERPKLSPPMPAEYPDDYTTYKAVGIRIQNIPYDGMLKRWLRRKAEEIVVIAYEVIDENGVTIVSSQGWWDHGPSTAIPPTGPYESGDRQMNLFGKHECAETAIAGRNPTNGTGEFGLGNYQLKLDMYNTEEQATNYIADLVVTADLQGFKIKNITPRSE